MLPEVVHTLGINRNICPSDAFIEKRLVAGAFANRLRHRDTNASFGAGAPLCELGNKRLDALCGSLGNRIPTDVLRVAEASRP